MSYIHIIVLFEIFIFLIALYFIMKIHMKNSRISIEKDFIDMYIESIEKMIEKAGVSLSIKTYLIILIVAPLITGIIVYLYIELMCLISTICTSKTHHFEYELKHL